LLFTADNQNPRGEACDPATPAPTISEVGVHDGLQPGGVTVSWKTDVPSNSIVLFREQGTAPWIQVGTPELTEKVHHVEVLGLDDSKEYEFAVRSETCNGNVTTDTNGGEGYDFFREPPPPVDLGPRTEHAAYDWETGAEGWTVQSTSDLPPPSVWERGLPGASDTENADGSRSPDSTKNGYHVSPYSDQDESNLISPAVTFDGRTAEVAFWMAHDLEPTFDFVHVEHSNDGGATWKTAESIDDINEHYPDFDLKVVQFSNPVPGGQLQIRFRFVSDELISSPAHLGVDLDKVSFASYPNSLPEDDGEALPLTGPVPPESAGATRLNPPPTRVNPTPADIAAGTGMCGDESVPQEDKLLTVIVQGSSPRAQGVVSSRPSGIYCSTGGRRPAGSDCSEEYPHGTQVTLAAQPHDSTDEFVGWGGACSGTQQKCVLTMDSDKEVTATFTEA
jgi:hypothetical protein